MKVYWSYAWILKVSTANLMYTRLQNYTNMVVGEHGIQTFKVLVVVLLLLLLSFDVFVPTSAYPSVFWTSGLSKYTQMSVDWGPWKICPRAYFEWLYINIIWWIVYSFHTYKYNNIVGYKTLCKTSIGVLFFVSLIIARLLRNKNE